LVLANEVVLDVGHVPGAAVVPALTVVAVPDPLDTTAGVDLLPHAPTREPIRRKATTSDSNRAGRRDGADTGRDLSIPAQ
jgi:hypothetical protein